MKIDTKIKINLENKNDKKYTLTLSNKSGKNIKLAINGLKELRNIQFEVDLEELKSAVDILNILSELSESNDSDILKDISQRLNSLFKEHKAVYEQIMEDEEDEEDFEDETF